MSNELQSLEKQKQDLESRLEEVRSLKAFYEKCQKFSFNDTLSKVVVEIINSVEKEEFTYQTFSLKERDREETEYRSPYEGMYGVNGTELRESLKPYTCHVEGESFKCSVIMDKSSYELFSAFTFSKCKDLKNNLARFLNDKKCCVIYNNRQKDIDQFYFSSSFPYISDFFELLTKWRFDNKTLDIPDEVVIDMSKEFIDSMKVKKNIKEI